MNFKIIILTIIHSAQENDDALMVMILPTVFLIFLLALRNPFKEYKNIPKNENILTSSYRNQYSLVVILLFILAIHGMYKGILFYIN